MKNYIESKSNKPRNRGMRVRTRHYGTYRRESSGSRNFKINKNRNA